MEGTMADKPKVTVSRLGNKHICDPTHTHVNGGDTVAWTGQEPFLVFFPDQTPFVEGRGPFLNGERVTVKGDVQQATYKLQILNNGVFLRDTEGDVQHP